MLHILVDYGDLKSQLKTIKYLLTKMSRSDALILGIFAVCLNLKALFATFGQCNFNFVQVSYVFRYAYFLHIQYLFTLQTFNPDIQKGHFSRPAVGVLYSLK